MYKLYWNRGTGAFAVETALRLSGADFEGVQVDHKAGAHHEADYLAINPAGQIPTLVLPDGQLMTESAAMVLHIADAFPDSGYWPSDPTERAVAFRWLVYASAQLYETDLRYSYPARYVSDESCAEAVRQAANAHVDKLWAILAEALSPGPYLFGDTFTLVDPYMAMLAAWHYDLPVLCAAQPRIQRLMEAVTNRPDVGEVWRKYGLRLPETTA